MAQESTTRGLTLEEEVFYANHAKIEICDDCHEWVPLHRQFNGKPYAVVEDGGFIRCLKHANSREA